MAPRQVSRAWLGRYALPRNERGQFTPGYVLWTRPDGESRFIHWPEPRVEPEVVEFVWATEQARRLLTHLFVIAVVAFLVIWTWPL